MNKPNFRLGGNRNLLRASSTFCPAEQRVWSEWTDPKTSVYLPPLVNKSTRAQDNKPRAVAGNQLASGVGKKDKVHPLGARLDKHRARSPP